MKREGILDPSDVFKSAAHWRDESQALIRSEHQALIPVEHHSINQRDLRFYVILARRSVPIDEDSCPIRRGLSPGMRGLPWHDAVGSRNDRDIEAWMRTADAGPKQDRIDRADQPPELIIVPDIQKALTGGLHGLTGWSLRRLR